MTLLDAGGATIPDADLRSCRRCGHDKRQTVSGFGRHWRELCSNCGYEFAAGTGAPPVPDDDEEGDEP